MKTPDTEVVTTCDHLKKLKYSTTLPDAFSDHGSIMLAADLWRRRQLRRAR